MKITYTVVLFPPRLQRNQFWKVCPLITVFISYLNKHMTKKPIKKQIKGLPFDYSIYFIFKQTYDKKAHQETNKTSLMVQWLGLCPSTAGGTGLIPDGRTKILHATRCDQKQKQKQKTPKYPTLLGFLRATETKQSHLAYLSSESTMLGKGWRRGCVSGKPLFPGLRF